MINRNELSDIQNLWDELADFNAAQSAEALTHLMGRLAAMIGADNAFWVGGVRMAKAVSARRDAQHGWRGRAVRWLHSAPEIDRQSHHAMRKQETDPDMTSCALTARAGTFRMHRLHDGFVDFAKFKRTAQYRAYYENLNVADRLWVVVPVNADAESYFVFDRNDKARRFSARDGLRAGVVLRAIKGFHRQIFLSHGLLVGQTPLSPTQHRVARLLLTGLSEKQIAVKLGQSFSTEHKHVMAVFQRFGVKSRAAFMAIWLGQG
jgi:DNA-binding CsgD family transcriptional regulator